MNDLATRLRLAFLKLADERGQDLVEFAMVIALIAFACTAGMGSLAHSINSAFHAIAGKMTIAKP